MNDYVKNCYTKNENEIKTKMIDGKTNKNDNENDSLNENSTGERYAGQLPSICDLGFTFIWLGPVCGLVRCM